MILIAGGTGTLGKRVVQLLTARGLAVRVLTRDPQRAANITGADVEVVTGDVRNPEAVAQAIAGVETVISAIQGFSGSDSGSPRTVGDQGNRHLIRAAHGAGVTHFIIVSVQGAASNHPLDLFHAKYQAEQALCVSGLTWTIIRPTASMETWAGLIGAPLLTTGKTRLFGRDNNPINFVAADDVARYVELAVIDSTLRGATIEVGGPENLTFRQFTKSFQKVTEKTGTISHVLCQ